MTFSRRTGWNTEENSFAAAIREAREQGRPLIDLTVSNPTLCGFDYDSDAILGALARPEAFLYDPNPFGMKAAREAVCGYYSDHGAQIDPGRVVLTASTSEGYSWLFRLLCDPGDEVLAPTPGYPLFDYLADIDDVQLGHYPLFYDFGWWIDFHALERSIGPRTRAILVVHPANPTGHATHPPEKERLIELCERRNLALIVDEVFLDYPTGAPIATFARTPARCLTFILSGLSKVAALPQMKVGWIVTTGPAADEAMRRLEVIADSFLSLPTPTQGALPTWLSGRHSIQQQIRTRIATNLETIRRIRLDHFPVEAGWSALLRLPHEPQQILHKAGLILHPGSFYELPGRGRAVVSLITDTKAFATGIRLLAQKP